MIKRCSDPSDKSYVNYGARGIFVCERWLLFENFLADMGEGESGLTIERQNNDGPYSPENCIWAPDAAQRRNKRSTRLVSYDGQLLCLRDACRASGLQHSCVYRRSRDFGETLQEAFDHLLRRRAA
jgi:hypothetical protein